MPKGGARTRSGPPPDPNALARDRDKGEWKILPASGRQGPTPDWPLPRPVNRERVLWAELWRRPQAIMWERQGQHLEVALYVRRLAEAEQRHTAVNLSTLVRQMADSLGLTTPGLRANRWRIEDETASEGMPSAPSRPRARDRLNRLKVVAGGSG